MARVSGPLAVLAGIFLMMPAGIAFVRAEAALGTLPGWLWRDLLVVAVGGVVLAIWGGSTVRRRELALHEIEQAERWLRMRR